MAATQYLNLGSGSYKKEGYINVDFASEIEPDVRHNLNEFPYPFDDHQFDRIEADHVLEHLGDPFRVMAEIYRIARNGCIVVIRVPHFSRGFTHADHKRGFDVTFPYYFNPSFPGGYQGIPLVHIRTHLTWFAQPYLKRQVMSPLPFWIGRALGVLIDFFANLSPFAAARLWCFWVGGFEEVAFTFRVDKS